MIRPKPAQYLWLLGGPIAGPLLGLACHAYRTGSPVKAGAYLLGAVAVNIGAGSLVPATVILDWQKANNAAAAWGGVFHQIAALIH